MYSILRAARFEFDVLYDVGSVFVDVLKVCMKVISVLAYETFVFDHFSTKND